MSVNAANSHTAGGLHHALAQSLDASDTPALTLENTPDASSGRSLQALIDPENKDPTVKAFDEVRGFVTRRTAEQQPAGQALLSAWNSTLNAHQLLFRVQQALQRLDAVPQAVAEGGQPASAMQTLDEQTAQLATLFDGLNQLAQHAAGAPEADGLMQHCRVIGEKLQQLQQVLARYAQGAAAREGQLHHQHGAETKASHGHHHHGAKAEESHGHHHHHGAEEGHGHHHHHHHHGGGAIMVDLDEAIHGLYAAISYMAQSIKGGGDELMRQFVAETQQMHDAPMDWMQHTVMPHGASDFAVSLGVAGVLTPFSLMAIKAGIEEMLGAAHTHHELTERLEQLQQRADYLDPLAAKFPAGSLPAVAALSNQQQMSATQFSRQQNRDGGRIGAFSFSSGASIAGKMGMESVAKIIGFAGGAVAPAVGVASTFALGPAAAVSATGLGGYMVHKSQKKAAAFAAEQQATQQQVTRLMGQIEHQPALKHYSQFLDQKMAQHKHFFNNYRDWNKGFLAGSGIYTAGTLAKVGVGAAALAGGLADPTGATPIVLLALIAAGGGVMGASSHQFFTGHGRHQRYEGYHRDDDMELNRHFLSSVDLLNLQEGEDSPLAGFSLRAAFFHQIAEREEGRQDFLQSVATQLGRQFSGQYSWTADTPEVVAKRGEKPGKRQTLKNNLQRMQKNSGVRLSSAASFAREAVKGNLRQGTAQAKETWNHQRPELSKTQLRRYLAAGGDEVHAQLTGMMRSALAGQITFSAAKRQAKLSACQTLSAHAQEVNLENKEDALQLQKLMVQLEHDLQQDNQWHSQLLAVESALKQPQDASDWHQTLSRFVTLQSGKPYDPDAAAPEPEASYQALASYLLKDAPTRYRDLRGKLLETELESTRLKDASGQWLAAEAPAV